jgi:signal transduction histidine kinase
MRLLSLRTWLALGLLLVVAAPVLAGAGAWAAAGRWQADREAARSAAAVRFLTTARLDTPATRAVAAAHLTKLGVEAQVGAGVDAGKHVGTDVQAGPQVDAKQAIAGGAANSEQDKMQLKQALAAPPLLTTAGLTAILDGVDGKQPTKGYTQSVVALPNVTAVLFVRRDRPAVRAAIALGGAFAALAAALALAVALLRRWVLRPLARLAADAQRIAGGELTPDPPVPTRAREVAEVGDALHGMAGALERALVTSAAAERERRFLVTAIAHDLRTPLFTLRGSLEAIERGIGNGDALGRAQAKAAHLDRLVGDLFAFSRAEYAHASEHVDIAEIARRAAETVDSAAVTLALVSAGPAPARGDAVALQRIFTNVLENAVRHARTRVDVSVAAGAAIVVEVADDGPGFAPADLEHVFEPLFRGDRSRSGTTGGAGLGLAIARRLARAHGGDVSAANGPAGARVTITLPA